jgi:hypothetical protein
MPTLLEALALERVRIEEGGSFYGVTDSDAHQAFVSWLDVDGCHRTRRVYVDEHGAVRVQVLDDATVCPMGGHETGAEAEPRGDCPCCTEWRATRWERGDDYEDMPVRRAGGWW